MRERLQEYRGSTDAGDVRGGYLSDRLQICTSWRTKRETPIGGLVTAGGWQRLYGGVRGFWSNHRLFLVALEVSTTFNGEFCFIATWVFFCFCSFDQIRFQQLTWWAQYYHNQYQQWSKPPNNSWGVWALKKNDCIPWADGSQKTMRSNGKNEF